MGFYPSGIIYGIRIYTMVDGDAVTLLEKTYDREMSYQDRKEGRDFYKAVPETQKQQLRFQMYTVCSSPYEDDFMMWYPISLDVFKEKFYL